MEEASVLLLTNLRRGTDLVKQFKSITSTASEEEGEVINIKVFVDQVIDSLKPAYKHRPIVIENDIEDSISLETIPRAITQVVTNLIMNSLHHGFDEEMSGSISFKGRRDGDFLHLVYKDTGKGMDKETLDHIFEPFYTTKKNANNSGLGMFIVHNLIHQTLGGSLKCKSQPNQGVTFLMTLPRKWKNENKPI
jgi:signal transduction histidine kinase